MIARAYSNNCSNVSHGRTSVVPRNIYTKQAFVSIELVRIDRLATNFGVSSKLLCCSTGRTKDRSNFEPYADSYTERRRNSLSARGFVCKHIDSTPCFGASFDGGVGGGGASILLVRVDRGLGHPSPSRVCSLFPQFFSW